MSLCVARLCQRQRRLLFTQPCSNWQDFSWRIASRGPSTVAERLAWESVVYVLMCTVYSKLYCVLNSNIFIARHHGRERYCYSNVSVRLSVKRWYCIETAEPIINQSTPRNLVFASQTFFSEIPTGSSVTHALNIAHNSYDSLTDK